LVVDLFDRSVQVVVLWMLVLQVMVVNCTSSTSCGTNDVYDSFDFESDPPRQSRYRSHSDSID
jgi:hypothetical protein